MHTFCFQLFDNPPRYYVDTAWLSDLLSDVSNMFDNFREFEELLDLMTLLQGQDDMTDVDTAILERLQRLLTMQGIDVLADR